ncbi:M23 family metallopeptidase [Spirochaetia bacterium 38H-sp]|uniref:M23 family metallopeptidase n=1 Tax=Rarispira pelagica TaxID=3141764 RepID=A0ABU9UDS7_9SPIR
MFIPHSENKVINVQFSFVTLLVFSLIFISVSAGFLWTGSKIAGVMTELTRKESSLKRAEANLDSVREEIIELREIASIFKKALSETAGIVGTGLSEDSPTGEGDLSGLTGTLSLTEGELKDVAELRELKVTLRKAIDSFSQIKNVLGAQKDLLVSIPSIWPVKDGKGIITQYFGPALHPFYKNWYLHKGVDIAYPYPVPVLATATGKVVEAKSDPLGYGNYVVIRHKYGFYTQYAHLKYFTVQKGQEVHQGQVIGLMGSTGLSTGRHVHYEVIIGSEVVDPLKFLNISENKTSSK